MVRGKGCELQARCALRHIGARGPAKTRASVLLRTPCVQLAFIECGDGGCTLSPCGRGWLREAKPGEGFLSACTVPAERTVHPPRFARYPLPQGERVTQTRHNRLIVISAAAPIKS